MIDAADGAEVGQAPIESGHSPDAPTSDAPRRAPAAVAHPASAADLPAPEAAEAQPHRAGCTTAQMRRFIKSRPYIPLHELRRRFQIEGSDDEVHGFESDARVVFVGLPRREADMLGELVRQGDVGYELLLDPECPLVIGVFPIRPVPHT